MGNSVLELKGDRELLRDLESLDRKMQKKIIRQMVRAGGREIAKRARRRAPVRFGILKKNIVTRARKRQRVGEYRVYVIPRDKVFLRKGERGGTVKVNPFKYHALVELGTAPHSLSRFSKGVIGAIRSRIANKNHPGAKPKPYLGPALEESRATAVQAMRVAMAKGIAKEQARATGR